MTTQQTSLDLLMTRSTTNFLNNNSSQPALKYWTIEDD